MLSILAAAIVFGTPEFSPEIKVDKIVDKAWQAASQVPQTPPDPAAVAEKKHQAELLDDREIGKKAAAEVDKEMKPSDDKVGIERVQRIGKIVGDLANQLHTVASYGDGRFNTFDYQFKVIKGKDVNAFSLPGGYIYVYDGLISYIESDDELAGILAHEISHAKFRHIATITRQENNLDKIAIPLVLLSILTGGVAAVMPALTTRGLLQQAEGSGWSVQAETAADFGGLQILEKSPWNATGLLTTMERLAADERFNPLVKDLGIYRTHPPSRERAEALIKHMVEANVPIQRSKVSTSLRVTASAQPDGTFELKFGKTHLFNIGGQGANARAQTASDRLNDFFDSTPEVFQVSTGTDGWVYGKNRPLIKVTTDDAEAAKTTLFSLQGQAVANIKRSVYALGYKTWN
jgi:Zn-dependent protease with chaperone function